MQFRKLLAAGLLALLTLGSTPVVDVAGAADGFAARAPRNAHDKHDREDLAAPLRERGEVRVIIGLQTPEEIARRVERRVERLGDRLKEQDVSARQLRVLQRLAGRYVRNVKRFRLHHFMAATVDAAALNALLADPEVTSVAEDRPLYPTLYDTPAITHADAAWAQGFRGGGQTVAIIDSGVATSHPFFTGKVIAEACFSDGGPGSTYCPNGQPQQIGPGAGVNCPDTDVNCWHGTHVAGIAVGKTGVLAANAGGMAPDASLIAIQVFHRQCINGTCGLSAFDSDMMHALEHVYSLRTTYNIASANLSLGGSSFSQNCDGESPGVTSVIESLRDAGIATVISSGNDANAGAIAFPACISSAISVGSTDKANAISSFSNSASFLSLLGTGNSVTSSVPGGYMAASGTSMAAPHVAGAWAVLKSAKPAATVTEVLGALQTSGVPITDPRNGVVKSLIRIGDTATQFGAIGVMLGQTTPPTVTLTAPSDGSTFVAPGYITLTASAAATRAAIARVEFYSGASKIHEVTAQPYTFVWSGVPTGTYSISARAVDNVGGTAVSSPANITVNPTGPSFQITGTISASGGPLAGVTLSALGASCTSTDSSGQYVCTVSQGWSGPVTPSLSGYSFSPPSRNYSNLMAGQTGQDYAAALGTDVVWIEDALPAGATPAGTAEGWSWVSTNPAPFSGTLAHQSALVSGIHQHYFNNATATLSVGTGQSVFAYVYLDPANPPTEVMLQWYAGASGWDHRAYWGANQIPWGTDGTVSRRSMGPLPPAGQWVRLEVPAALVGLEGATVTGMSFALYGGRATWDRAGRNIPTATTYSISGTVTVSGTGLSGVSMGISGAGTSCSATNGSGQYSCTVPSGWTGMVTPSFAGYTFAPPSRSYSSLAANQTVQNYTATAVPPSTFAVSGTVTVSGTGLSGVSMGITGAGTSCSATNGSGQYSCTVPSGWTGTVTPSFAGYTFAPPSRSYASVAANQTGQDYTATTAPPVTFAVSGTVTVSGAGLSGVSMGIAGAGTSCSATDGSGQYSCTVPQGWTGTVTPALSGYVFTPPSRSYTNTTADQTGQDYAAATSTDVVWIEDALPAGAVPSGTAESWSWVSANPAPFSGSLAHQSALVSGIHQHYFTGATATLSAGPGQSLFTYVYLDPANPPSEVMLQWYSGADGWNHRAYWGANLIPWGTDGTVSRRSMGALPPAGQWVRLEVPAALVGLEGSTINGMAFALYGGRATWDRAGRAIPAATTFSISGTVTVSGTGLSGVSMGITGAGTSCSATNGSGQYSCTVPSGWTGTVTPSFAGYTFAPPSRSYSSVAANQTAQDYTASAVPPSTFAVSGTVTVSGSGLSGVSMGITGAGTSCSATNGSGQYSCTVPAGWTGTVTPSFAGYTFAPPSRSYSSVAANQTAQDYTAAPITFALSGTVTVSGAGLSGVSMGIAGAGTNCSATNGSGQYSCTVPQGWTGTVTPASSSYTFTPPSRSYSNVTVNQTGQDYTAATSTDVVWVEDVLPAGATPSGTAESWSWISANPAPFSGSLAHQSALASGIHQHYFGGATATLSVGPGQSLFAYVYLDPANPPSEVMLQWYSGASGWDHRAYWGANQIPWGTDGTVSRRFMGPLPAAGQWVRLEVPAALVGLEGSTVTGMAYTLYGGRATWDRAGKAGGSSPTLGMQPVATGFASPVGIEHAGDARLFVVQQGGQIRIISGGQVLPAPFLNITSLVATGSERGLLGLAFHPNYAANGFFYLNYTRQGDGATVIARYQRSASDPDAADPGSGQILLTVDQPFANHNGGQLRFGPDGYLYIALGDGGSGNDPGNRGQELGTLLGKMLRIDVNGGSPYAVPASNPFANDGSPSTLAEIWAYGLRNPWRFSFDRSTGDLFIADVGQNAREEINFQLAGAAGGANYGWRVMEGTSCTGNGGGAPCFDPSFTPPILEYDHGLGCSVTGGYRYRGAAYPALSGYFVYGDYCSGRIWGALRNANGSWAAVELSTAGFNISTFGEDAAGELYVAAYNPGNTGVIYRLTAQ